jgi:hypothetical protein
MKRPLYAVIIVLLLATLACSVNINIPTMAIGPTKTFTVNEPVPDANPVAVNLNMGAGTLDLSSGTSSLVEGTITYNVPNWDPKVTQTASGVTIVQGEETTISGIPSDKLVNDWAIKLNETTPMDLTIKAGAYKGSMDLSSMHIHSLDITDGASQNKVTFNIPNPEQMVSLNYRTGASQVELDGLANANFSTMSFEGGAGEYTFDFSGTLNQNATATIKTGVSSITIDVPMDMAVIFVNSGGVSNITTTGTWTVNGNTYTSSGAGQGYTLTINAQIAVGTVKLNRR